MYLFLPLIPDLAMVRDRMKGWRKIPYRILSLGFRGTEGEWKNLTTTMNIFAFAIIPVMFSVHTIVSWDFAMAMRPGWSTARIPANRSLPPAAFNRTQRRPPGNRLFPVQTVV